MEIVGDSKSLERAFARSAKSANNFNRDVSQMSRGAAAGSGAFTSLGRSVAFASGTFLGAAGLTAVVKDSVGAASDLNEQVSKTNVVFGKSAAGIQSWSKTTADAFGLSRRQALATASSFGALFAPIGIVGKAAADQSRRLTQLGADLASFYNTDVQDALDAIKSGLVGESEPLRRYGVLLSETRVQQEAMTETGKKNAKALTTQEKALARINLIFKDTGKAQGDFRRTSGGLANQTRILKANLDDLKTTLGQGLVPALTQASRAANLLLKDMFALSKPVVIGGPGSLERNRKIIEQFLSLKDVLKIQKELDRAGRGLQGPVGEPAKPFVPPGLQGPAKADVQAAKRSAEQLNEWFDAMISRRQFRAGLAPLRQQLALLRQVAVLLTRRIGATKDITRKLNLEDQLLQVNADRAQIRAELHQQMVDQLQQQAEQAKAAAEAAKEAARAAAERAKAARTAAQFRLLGFGPTGEDLIPGVASLKKHLEGAQKALQGSFLDTRKTRSMLSHIRRVLAGGLGAISDEVRSKIADMLNAIDDQLKQHGRDRTAFRHLSAQQFVDSLGLNLTAAQRRRIGIAFTGTSAGGATPRRGLAFAGVTVNGDVHVHGVQNPKAFEEELTKRGKARSHRRRGRQ